MKASLKRLAVPAALVALALFAWLLGDVIAKLLPANTGAIGAQIVEAFLLMGIAWLATAALDTFVWQRIDEERRPPRLLTDLLTGFVLVATALIVASQIFELPVTSIVTTSGIAIAVLGFALRDMLASVFAGIALNVERPYHIGDWLALSNNTVGQVREISWLTTRLVTRDKVSVIVPNAQLSTHGFENYGRTGQRFRDTLTITLDHALPIERIERILNAAAADVPAIVRNKPGPDVLIDAFLDNGVCWRIRYWLSDYRDLVELRHKLQRSILRHLHQAGISLPYGKLDVFHAPMPTRVLNDKNNIDQLLARSDLFAALSDADLGALAASARRRRVGAGEVVVRQGDPGSSLFVVIEGLLGVTFCSDHGDQEVNMLSPGASFGEFALLTDEPRSATVCAQRDSVLIEIVRDDLAPILKQQPDLAGELSRILSERQAQTAAITRRRSRTESGPSPDPRSDNALLDRIRALFGLTSEHGGVGVAPDHSDQREEKS